MINTAYSV